jgi:hypothetical protein
MTSTPCGACLSSNRLPNCQDTWLMRVIVPTDRYVSSYPANGDVSPF